MEFSDKVGCAIIQMTIPSHFSPLNAGCSVFDDKILHKNESSIAIIPADSVVPDLPKGEDFCMRKKIAK